MARAVALLLFIATILLAHYKAHFGWLVSAILGVIFVGLGCFALLALLGGALALHDREVEDRE